MSRVRRNRGTERAEGTKTSRRKDRTQNPRKVGGTRRFSYKPRSPQQTDNRKPRGRKDNWLKPEIQEYRYSDENHIRILPPLGLDIQHFGIPMYIHYEVGFDKRQYLCRNKMLGEPCPVCEEWQKALDSGDTQAANKLRPKFYWSVWVWDVLDEKCQQPKFYRMWASLDDNIVSLSKIKNRDGSVRYLQVDHPTEGFDIMYEVFKDGGFPKARAVQIARESTAVPEDFLIYVEENPITDVFKYYDYEYIEEILHGKDMNKTDDVENVKGKEYTEQEILDMSPEKLELIALDEIKIPTKECENMSDDELLQEVLEHFGYGEDELKGEEAE